MRRKVHTELGENYVPFRLQILTVRRKKLEPEFERAFLSKVDKRLEHSKIQEPSSDAQSIIQAATPPWAESYDMSSSHDGSLVLYFALLYGAYVQFQTAS